MEPSPSMVQQALMAINFILFLLLLALVYVILWFRQTLQQAVDTIYICFALDKEVGKVSKPEVHEVYVLLPTSDSEGSNLAVGLSGR